MSRVNAKRYGWFLLALFLGITLAACEKDHQSGPITYLLPWPGQDGEYRMQEVELHTIRYADRLEGAAAKIYLKSGIKDGDFQGEVARPRLIKKSKRRYVAADYESAMAIAVYAHYERFMMWDKELGIDSDLSWPRKVGIEMNMRTKTGDREHNNARYVAKWDVTLVAPTSVDGLPMALNGGVLAHEHFHAHFHARAIRYLQENWSAGSDLSGNEIRDTNVYLIRSWNEGLADFWGYLYTRDPRFMVKTFVREYHVRQLDEVKVVFRMPLNSRAELMERSKATVLSPLARSTVWVQGWRAFSSKFSNPVSLPKRHKAKIWKPLLPAS